MGNPSIQEVIAMKKLSALILVAILGIVFWALPAGAEKIRLSDAEMDGITAGTVGFPCGQVCIPPPNSLTGIVEAGINAFGGLAPGPHGTFEAGGGTMLAKGIGASIHASGQDPTAVEGNLTIVVNVRGNISMIVFQGSVMKP
jgi:hypothetical protein